MDSDKLITYTGESGFGERGSSGSGESVSGGTMGIWMLGHFGISDNKKSTS